VLGFIKVIFSSFLPFRLLFIKAPPFNKITNNILKRCLYKFIYHSSKSETFAFDKECEITPTTKKHPDSEKSGSGV
jgi:hypothetical protein